MNITQDRLKILEIMSSLSIDRASRALSKSLGQAQEFLFQKYPLRILVRLPRR